MLGRELAKRSLELVYGGGNIGLMIGDALESGSVSVRVIELDERQAERAAEALPIAEEAVAIAERILRAAFTMRIAGKPSTKPPQL